MNTDEWHKHDLRTANGMDEQRMEWMNGTRDSFIEIILYFF